MSNKDRKRKRCYGLDGNPFKDNEVKTSKEISTLISALTSLPIVLVTLIGQFNETHLRIGEYEELITIDEAFEYGKIQFMKWHIDRFYCCIYHSSRMGSSLVMFDETLGLIEFLCLLVDERGQRLEPTAIAFEDSTAYVLTGREILLFSCPTGEFLERIHVPCDCDRHEELIHNCNAKGWYTPSLFDMDVRGSVIYLISECSAKCISVTMIDGQPTFSRLLKLKVDNPVDDGIWVRFHEGFVIRASEHRQSLSFDSLDGSETFTIPNLKTRDMFRDGGNLYIFDDKSSAIHQIDVPNRKTIIVAHLPSDIKQFLCVHKGLVVATNSHDCITLYH